MGHERGDQGVEGVIAGLEGEAMVAQLERGRESRSDRTMSGSAPAARLAL